MSRKPVVARTILLLLCGCLLLVAPRPLAADCPCSETVATYPYVEDFEEGLGLWMNVEGDDFDWERHQGSTPSDPTGPDADHTLGTEEGHYMYTEASGDNYPEKTAILVGPCFDLSSLSEPEMSFWYHMAGETMGSLYLEVSGDDCATWDLVFERHGHQDWWDWLLEVVDLSAYAGQTIAVRFRGITGDDYYSDMAIDDIYVGEALDYPGGCCDLDTGDCLGFMTEAECLAQGNVAWYLLSDCTEDNFCPQPPPANDICEDAVVIDSLPFTDWEVDFKWVTPDLPVSCDGDECDDGYGVWYTYTPTEYCGARITTDGGMQAFIAAFTGNDCGDLAEVYCTSEHEDWNKLEATFNMDAGTTYWILVGKFHCESDPWTTINITFNCSLGACCLGETCSLETATDCEEFGSYYFGDDTSCEPDACLYGACCTSNGCESLTADDCAAADGDFLGNGVPCELDTCPPVNETCATALPVTDGAPAAQGDTTLASTDDDEEASCYEWSDKDLWYAYTATCTGTVAVDTEGSEVSGTVLSVWDECGGEEIACAYEGPSGSLAALEFDAIAGLTYYIRIAPHEFADGMFQINVSCTEAPQGACCFGDVCTIDYQLTCEAAGGSYGGDDTSCPGDDCNGNGVEDICDILNGDSEDCNENRIPDECDIEGGTSLDRDGNGVPDECDPDCNDNGIIDGCDLSCDGGCAEIDGCGQSADCQGDGIPDDCQLEIEGCDGVRYDNGYGDLVEGFRPDWGWAFVGMADDFTLDEDAEGSCFRFDIYDSVDSGNLPVMRVRVFENYDGLMDLGDFWAAVPVFDQTYSLDDGTLEILDTGEDLYYFDLLRFVASGTDWSLSAGDYAIHLTFPETWGEGFWATAGTDDTDCAVYWGDWWSWPSEVCYDEFDATRMSFALLGAGDNDCNENDVPDECDIAAGTSTDCNGDGTLDECQAELVPCGGLDLKPGSCPNSYNRNSHGVLPTALVGTEDFDVSLVDIASLRIWRVDGVGGELAPHEGPPGPHTVVDDVATPFEGQECDCHDLTGDGVDDLLMHFETDQVVPILELNDLPAGALVPLAISGNLTGGASFVSPSDCLRLVPPGTAGAMLSVESSVAGAYVDAEPLDETLDGPGFADFQRTYPLGTVVTLTAEESVSGCSLRGWYLGDFLWHRSSVTFTLTEGMTVKAVYRAPPPWSHSAPVVPPEPDTSAPAGAGMLRISDGG